ncbi:putative lipid-transfer protein DIR1 [Juglans microcarpa x Juglans regia]|uniref:putative lipid-transfer protein DIR1 n=1 Tax=Juglans microcarpa x Juglans regia TaxID=2249226 RepID=UPI001B7F3DC5|nr:putative lipid-transfer protein DIR1 [Juglans microcarpa x Juglans regia]
MEFSVVKKLIFIVTVLFVAFSSIGRLQVCNAQSLCNVPYSGLMECKPSVTPPNPTAPSASCCSALSHADLRCLCSYRNSNLLPSLGIDPNLAMQLPGKCKLPNAAHC